MENTPSCSQQMQSLPIRTNRKMNRPKSKADQYQEGQASVQEEQPLRFQWMPLNNKQMTQLSQ
jgi:hypothetical protein